MNPLGWSKSFNVSVLLILFIDVPFLATWEFFALIKSDPSLNTEKLDDLRICVYVLFHRKILQKQKFVG